MQYMVWGTDVIKPDLWDVTHKTIGGSDEVHGHNESESLAEGRPESVAPLRPSNTPLAYAPYLPRTTFLSH